MIRRLSARYRGAIFDFDGVLADSMRVWDGICRDWLSSKGVAPEPALEQNIECMTLHQAAEYVVRRYTLSVSPAQAAQDWEKMVLHQYEHTVQLKDGAAEFVKNLFAAGMKLGIATSCFPGGCEGFLARQGLRDFFSAIAYSDEVNRDKTFPDIYLACAERLGVASAACVVFEDFYAASAGVRAAGMGLAAVYDPSFARHWSAFKETADFWFKSFRFEQD